MRIGLTGGGSTTSLWYASNVARDPLTAMAIAGRETSRIELGSAQRVASRQRTIACLSSLASE